MHYVKVMRANDYTDKKEYNIGLFKSKFLLPIKTDTLSS